MLEQYQTLVEQEAYQPLGLLSLIIGLFLVAYLFMYSTSLLLVIKTLTKPKKDRSTWKSFSHSCLQEPSQSESSC